MTLSVAWQVLERVVTCAPGVGVLLELVADLAAQSPHDLLAQSLRLREALGYLSELPGHHADELLRAVIPLFALQVELLSFEL